MAFEHRDEHANVNMQWLWQSRLGGGSLGGLRGGGRYLREGTRLRGYLEFTYLKLTAAPRL